MTIHATPTVQIILPNGTVWTREPDNMLFTAPGYAFKLFEEEISRHYGQGLAVTAE